MGGAHRGPRPSRSADVSELIAADRTHPAGRLVAFGADVFVSDGTFIRNADNSAKIASSCDVFGAFAIDGTSVYADSTHWVMQGHGAYPGAEQMVRLRR